MARLYRSTSVAFAPNIAGRWPVLSIRSIRFVVRVSAGDGSGAEPEGGPMRYVLLIYGPERTEEVPPDVQQQVMVGYRQFTEAVRARGILGPAEALEPTTTATTVRVRNGQTLTTDGPFAETKEALGGFYIVDARDLDDAIELAARIPGALDGSIEIRPIWEVPAEAGSSTQAAGTAS
jgi:hypothetical protein